MKSHNPVLSPTTPTSPLNTNPRPVRHPRTGPLTLIFILVLHAASTNALPQSVGGGTVDFDNYVPYAGLDAPVFAEDGQSRLAGPAFLAQLWAGTSPSNLMPVDRICPFETGPAAGYWNVGASGTVNLPSVPPGATAYVQVRVWESAKGTTYAQALQNGARIGKSRIFTLVTGGAGEPPSFPALLIGLTSFRLGDNPHDPASSTCDFNRDGSTDILWRHNQGFLSAWLMQGASRQQPAWLSPNFVADPKWSVVATRDFDANGTTDLIWQHADGTLSAWLMNGLIRQQAILLTPSKVDPNWRIVASGDFNQDQKPDLIWQHTDGWLSAWLMDGTTLRSALYLSPKYVADRNWRIVGAGDFNLDGHTDILWQHAQGELSVWLMSRTDRLLPLRLTPTSVADTRWKIVGVGDLDLDGQPDILWQHADGTLSAWFMDGIKLRQPVLLNPERADPAWRIVGPK